MISEIRKNKSLTFYQPTFCRTNNDMSAIGVGSISAGNISTTVNNASMITTQFNAQYSEFTSYFNQVRNYDLQNLDLTQANSAARSRGVYRAWEYEKADILMGGSGTENWTNQEQQEILEKVIFDNQKDSRSGLRGAEGHHQKNVADHPEQQANPDNIKFYRTREEHLEKGHNGDWHNESDAPMLDKNRMLEMTNKKRVVRNELKGIGLAVAIGVGMGFTIGFAVSLAQTGVSPDSVKYAFAEGGKMGAVTGVQSLITYGIGRTIGQVVVKATEGILANIGVEITENVSRMCNMGVVGSLSIMLFSAYQFYKLKRNGMATKEALINVGKQTLFSLSLLAVSIAAQGIWGGPAGIIVSISTGIILVTYTVVDISYQRMMSEKVRSYMIAKCKPIFA